MEFSASTSVLGVLSDYSLQSATPIFSTLDTTQRSVISVFFHIDVTTMLGARVLLHGPTGYHFGRYCEVVHLPNPHRRVIAGGGNVRRHHLGAEQCRILLQPNPLAALKLPLLTLLPPPSATDLWTDSKAVLTVHILLASVSALQVVDLPDAYFATNKAKMHRLPRVKTCIGHVSTLTRPSLAVVPVREDESTPTNQAVIDTSLRLLAHTSYAFGVVLTNPMTNVDQNDNYWSAGPRGTLRAHTS